MEAAIRDILDTAVWAPSGDNSQPWTFTLRGDVLRVHLDPNRDNPILNYKLSGTYIAHGALIENIVLAAPLFGYRAHARTLPDPADSLCTAEITFTESQETPDPLAAHIRARHTNRKPYRREALPRETYDALAHSADAITGAKLTLIEDRASIRAAAAASALMEQVALETPAVRELFVGSILWSDEENQAGEQGLYIDTMELPLPARLLLRHIKHPRVLQIAERIRFSRIAARTDAHLYSQSAAMGLITISHESAADYLAAGRVLERAWLEATKEGIAFQPVTGILFLARGVADGTLTTILSTHAEYILSAGAAIRKQFGVGSGIPLLLFRVGGAAPATARSARKQADVAYSPV